MPLKIHMISEYGVPQFKKNDLRHKILNLRNVNVLIVRLFRK